MALFEFSASSASGISVPSVGDTLNLKLTFDPGSSASLDPTFSDDGKATGDFAGNKDEARAMVIQPDGKIVAAGFANDGSDNDFALARYNTDGTLDTTFSADGKVTTDFAGNDDEANAVAIQSDGKIVAAGFANDGSDDNFALARYNADGSLDTTFSSDGKVTTDFGGNDDEVRAVAIQPDGKIVAAGFANDGSDNNFALARYNTNGSLDTTFSSDGKLTTDFDGKDDEAYAVAIQPDGRIVAAGYATNTNQTTTNTSDDHKDFALTRYNSDGSLDESFSNHTKDFGRNHGKVTSLINTNDQVIYAVAIQPDGKIVVAGRSWSGINNDFAVERYRPDGGRDISFGTPVGNIKRGRVTTDFSGTGDYAHTIALQSDGKIVVAGRSWSNGNHNFALVRYTTQGDLDSTFGGGGKVVTDINSDDLAHAVALQSDRKIVAAGYSSNNFALTRYMGDFALDYLNSMGVNPKPNARTSFSGQGYPGYYNVLHYDRSSADYLIRNISYQSAGPLTSWPPAFGYGRVLPSDPYTPAEGLPQQSAGSITLTPPFDPEVQEYSATVPYEVSSVIITAVPVHSKATATVNGNSPSTPVSLEVGENVVTVVVTTESDLRRTYTLTITREPNKPPTVSSAIADATIVNETATHQVTLSGVFSDAEGDDLTVTAGSSDENVATVSVSADYSGLTVSAKSHGTATVTVTADDGHGGSVSDSLTVTVKAAPVVASPIADVSELAVEATHQVSMSGVFSDADGDAVTVTQASSSDSAVAAVTAAIDGSTSAITAITVTGVSEGTATITVTAQDADGNTVSDAFEVTVSAPPNNAPTVSGVIADATIVSESGTHETSLSGVFDDSDGDDLTVTAASSAESVATVSVSADYSKLTVSAKSRGTATVTVTASDGNGGTALDSFTVTVKAAPVVASAIADVSELEVDATHQVSMSGVFSDPDGDAVTVSEASSSDIAVAAVSAAIDGSTSAITGLTVIAKSEGTATITVTAKDSDGNTVSDAFDVTVNSPAAQQQVNNAPTVSAAIADAIIVNETGTHRVALSGVFSDADGDALKVTTSSSAESVASVAVSADYSTLTVSAKSRGTATVTVTAADGYGGTVEDAFTVTVKAAPVVASAISDVSGLEAGSTREVSLSGVFSDADGDSLTITASSSNEATATVSVESDSSKLTVTGVAEGTATITVTAQDTDGNTVSDTFNVTVIRAPEPEPEPVELPGPVGNLQLTATHDSVSVSWSTPESGDAPDGYIVNIKRQGGGDGETRRPGVDKTALTFRDLNGGSTYEVWVRAENEAGKGERVRASVTLPSVLPGPVAGLEVAATGDGVTVTWSAPETGGAPDGYIVHIRPEGGAEGSGRTKTPKAKKSAVTFGNLEAGWRCKDRGWRRTEAGLG
ncbi:MAG: Ig-like domain-containing protein, partial [Deltaproteobacteria bacterium]|nr:Ig-like domain-containing protein [Deltaproteobacteria bacterium]